MKEEEQKNKLYDLFYLEQGKFYYYTCGLSVIMLGYVVKIVNETTNDNDIWLLFVSIALMFISLLLGLYGLKYRLSNFYNTFNILDIKEKALNRGHDLKESANKVITENGEMQNLFLKLHIYVLLSSPISLFIWLFLKKMIF